MKKKKKYEKFIKEINESLQYWSTECTHNENRYMFWRTVATVSLLTNGVVIGAIIAAIIFR